MKVKSGNDENPGNAELPLGSSFITQAELGLGAPRGSSHASCPFNPLVLGDVTDDGVKYQLAKLKRQGLICRVGPDKGGHWEVRGNGELKMEKGE